MRNSLAASILAVATLLFSSAVFAQQRAASPAKAAPVKVSDPFIGVWKLSAGRRAQSVKVTGPLSTNQGEIAVQWALGGHGIVLRSVWEVQSLLDSGQLVQLLPSPAGAAVQRPEPWLSHNSPVGQPLLDSHSQLSPALQPVAAAGLSISTHCPASSR